MSGTVFVSYKREDEPRVGRLVQALEKVGLDVWWDRGVPGGASWRADIQDALTGAKCVVVAWTLGSTSAAGDFVRDEARQAKERGILVPVALERGVRPPLGFGEVQTIDLSHWRGDLNDLCFRDLVAAVQAKLEGKAAPPAKGPMARLVRRLTIGSIASAIVACAFGFATNVLSVQDQVCTMPIGQPGVSDACGALGLGNRPTHEARVAFDALPPGDCTALERFRDAYESSPLRAIADSRLSARTTTQDVTWVANDRRLTMFAGGATEVEARARAATRAASLCAGFAATTQYRVASAEATGSFSCEGGACGISGEAICHVQERELVMRERCGAGP